MLAVFLNVAGKTITDSIFGDFIRYAGKAWFSPAEFRQLTRIAGPLIVASLVTMSISITDVIMIGKLGTVELAAGAAASDFYSIFYYLAAGVIAAISPLIAQARGNRAFSDVKPITLLGLAAGLLTGIPAAIAVYHAPYVLTLVGVKRDIISVAAPYSQMMAIAIFPMLATMAMHHFLSAHGKTRIILYVTACALPVNIVGNYLLLYGNLGFPRLGLAGAGIATAVTGVFMFASMAGYVALHPRFRRYWYLQRSSVTPLAQIKEIFHVGLPIGVCHVGEMGVFLFSTVTMGVFGAEVLAAHTIALRAAGVFYAVPLGYAQAATVRVAYLFARKDNERLQQALRTVMIMVLAFGIVLMLFILTVKDGLPAMVLDPDQITSEVLAKASTFLVLLAVMQVTINLGTVGAGVLRGFKDTRIPMMFSLFAYWGFGFGAAMLLAMAAGLNGSGIWVGLLTATAVFALLVWRRLYRYYWAQMAT
ncbi:MAG: MATE family efflux transporter, partial [Gammaproteobacteria bacterium]